MTHHAASGPAARSTPPPHTPWIMPYLTVRDAINAATFYEQAFGFERRDMLAGPEGKILHVEMRWRDGVVMFGPEGAFGEAMQAPATSGGDCPINLYVYVEDVDAVFQQALRAGGEVCYEPRDMFWGDRCAQVRDPDGYRWTLATNVGEFDPSKLPGTQ